MRSVTVLAILLPVLVGTAACSLVLELVLFNNTGVPIAVNAGWGPVIAPGQSTHFHYPNSVSNWTMRISAGGCDYLYQAPKSLEHYPWPMDYKTDPTAQVEPDFSIWVIPPDAKGTTEISRLTTRQPDGFPLHPLARECH